MSQKFKEEMIDLPAGRPLRILITRADRIGDLIVSTPVFKEVRKYFPNAWIAGLTFLENREALEGHPDLNEVLLYDKKGSEEGWLGNLRFALWLARKKFDVVIHLHATNRMHGVTFAARIPVRIGWSRKLGWALTHAFEDRKKEGKKHEALYNFELLAPLGIPAPDKPETYFPLTEKSRESLEMLLKHHGISREKPWIVLSPGASCRSKRWPAERFGELAEKIAAQYPVQFIAAGTAAETPLIAKMQKSSAVPVHDLSGRLSIGMLGILLKDAALLISNDSGPVHVASAVGTPVISIFGRKQQGLSPTRWRPLGKESRVLWKDTGCDPCLAHACQINFLCLDAIFVDDVLGEVNRLFQIRNPKFEARNKLQNANL